MELPKAVARQRLAAGQQELERDSPVSRSVDELEWNGPAGEFAAMADRIDGPRLSARASKIASERFAGPGSVPGLPDGPVAEPSRPGEWDLTLGLT